MPRSTKTASTRAGEDRSKSTLERYRLKRLEKISLQNKKLKLELERIRGTHVEFEAIKRQVIAANTTVKNHLLALPYRLAQKIASMTEPSQIQELLRKEI